MSSYSPPYTTTPEFYTALGQMVVTWNLAEIAMRDLHLSILGATTPEEGFRSQIVTVELGNVALPNSLGALAKNYLPQDIGPHVLHAVEYYSRVREYRNYYVHGIITVGSEGGSIGYLTAKGQLTSYGDVVPIERLYFVIHHSESIAVYIEKIMTWRGTRGVGDPALRPELPHKPPLPDKLLKPRQHLKDGWPPPLTSPS